MDDTLMFQIDEDYLKDLSKAAQHPIVDACITLHQAWMMGRIITCYMWFCEERNNVLWAQALFSKYLVQSMWDMVVNGCTVTLYRDRQGNIATEMGLLEEYPAMAFMRTNPREADIRRFNKLFDAGMKRDCQNAIKQLCDAPAYIPERLDPCNLLIFYETDLIGNVLQMYVIPKALAARAQGAVDKKFVRANALRGVRVHFNEKTLAGNEVTQASSATKRTRLSLFRPPAGIQSGRIDGKKTVFSEVAQTLRPLNIVADMEVQLGDLTWVATKVPYAMVNDLSAAKDEPLRNLLAENISLPLLDAFDRARQSNRTNNFFEHNETFRSRFLEHAANNIVTTRKGVVPYDMRQRRAAGELMDYREYYRNSQAQRTLNPTDRAKNTMAGPSVWHEQVPYFCFQNSRPEYMPVQPLNAQHIALYQMQLDHVTDIFGIPLAFLRQDNRAVSANGRQDRTLKTSRHHSNEKSEYFCRNIVDLLLKTTKDICKAGVDRMVFKVTQAAAAKGADYVRERLRDDFDEDGFSLKRRRNSQSAPPTPAPDTGAEEGADSLDEDASEQIAEILRGVFRIHVSMENPQGADIDTLVKVHQMNLVPAELLRKKAAIIADVNYELENMLAQGTKEEDLPSGIPLQQLVGVESLHLAEEERKEKEQEAKKAVAAQKAPTPSKKAKNSETSSPSRFHSTEEEAPNHAHDDLWHHPSN